MSRSMQGNARNHTSVPHACVLRLLESKHLPHHSPSLTCRIEHRGALPFCDSCALTFLTSNGHPTWLTREGAASLSNINLNQDGNSVWRLHNPSIMDLSSQMHGLGPACRSRPTLPRIFPSRAPCRSSKQHTVRPSPDRIPQNLPVRQNGLP